MDTIDDFAVIRYTLELQAPVLATDIIGEPNSAVTLPYISGALLRGALVARYLLRGATSLDAGTEGARQRIFGERTRFLNAYPFHPELTNKEKRRALPTPCAWRRDKQDFAGGGEKWKTYDFSHRAADIRDEATDGAFFWGESEAALFSSPRQLNVHTQRDARLGRATEQSGAVYRYEALAAGTQWQALILTTPALAEEIAGWLRGATLWIGRARRAGYGRAIVTNVERPDYWRESGADDSPAMIEFKDKPEKELHIAFTSDALLRDGNGQATLDPRAALAAALGLPSPELLEPAPKRSWAASKIVGGFNRKWKLPLPQSVALAAGSVFVYQTRAEIGWQPLRELERLGLGERRNEGFGRVLVNWLRGKGAVFASYEIRLSPVIEPAPLSNEEKDQAQVIANLILRRQLDEKLREKINQTQLKPAPHKSQLARLRAVLRGLRHDGVPDAEDDKRIAELREHFDFLLKRRSTKTQFHGAQVWVGERHEPLLTWLQDQLGLLTEDEDADEAQAANQEEVKEPESRKAARRRLELWRGNAVSLGKGVAAVTAAVDEHLAREYALRFVDQVLYRASKEQSREDRQ